MCSIDRNVITLEAINSLIRVADVESRGIIDSFRGMDVALHMEERFHGSR